MKSRYSYVNSTLEKHTCCVYLIQLYSQLNKLNVCLSYSSTIHLIDELSKKHTVPLQKWIKDGKVVNFWGDNVDKKQRVRDYRSDHHGTMIHMFSIMDGVSRTPAPELSHTGHLSTLAETPPKFFLPSLDDVNKVKMNRVVLISRVLTHYIPGLASFAKVVPKHIQHKYSKVMCNRSEVFVLDVLMKNEAKHSDMMDIMSVMQGYLREGYEDRCVVACGGDQLTDERLIGAQKHRMDGDTARERLELLEPVVEDWHALVCLLKVIKQTNVISAH